MKNKPIKNLLDLIKKSIKQEAELFKNNSDDIIKSNQKLLKRLLIIVFPILVTLIIISPILPNFSSLKSGYILLFCETLLIFALTSKIKYKRICLVGLYLYLFGIYSLTVYVSVFVFPDFDAVSIIGVLCLAPLAILDKSWRINACIIGCYVLHSLLALNFKPSDIAIDDIITIGSFTLTGLFISTQTRKFQLENFELKRNAQIGEHTDFVTKLPNRRKMYATLVEHEKSKCEDPIVGVMMLDIDMFKQFNDFYGHQMGDNCLTIIGKCLEHFGYENDLEFFRYGGEEFTAFTYTHTYSELMEISRQLNKTIQELNIVNEISELKKVTLSIGVSQSKENHSQGYEHLIGLADEALYKAKSSGRNTVVGYSECNFNVELKSKIF